MPPRTNGSQKSVSMPSTPRQRPRGSGSRSPSPRGMSESHTPVTRGPGSGRTFAPAPVSGPVEMLFINGHPACRYDLNSQFLGKRRMQYNIGDAPLDTMPGIKDTLTALQETKLNAELTELYNQLLPTPDSERRRALFIAKIEGILRKEWPGTEFKAHVFGSSGNMLYTSDSDIDICIETPLTELGSMHQIAAVLVRNGMERVVCVPAKVPIVKMWDPKLDMAADINVNNTLALENTRMIKSYVMIDARVRPLAMIIKHWTRRRVLNDAGPGGTISSYAWICMIINFLQTRQPPILPALQARPHREYRADDGSEAGYDDQIQHLEGFGKANLDSLAMLVFQFFRYYSFEFDYAKSVVCVRKGKPIPRTEKNWGPGTPGGLWSLCIEEPFNQTRNLGNSCDATAFRGIHIELRSAFIALSKTSLDRVMEPYEFNDAKEEKAPFRMASVSLPAPATRLEPAPAARPAIATSDHLPSNRGHRSNGRRTRINDNGINGGGIRAVPTGPSNRRAPNGSTVTHSGHYPPSQGPFAVNVQAQAESIAMFRGINVVSGQALSNGQPIYVPLPSAQPVYPHDEQSPSMFVPTAQLGQSPFHSGHVYVFSTDQAQCHASLAGPLAQDRNPATMPEAELGGIGASIGPVMPQRRSGRVLGPVSLGFSSDGRPLYGVPVDPASHGWNGEFAYYAFTTERGRPVDSSPKEYVGYFWAVPRAPTEPHYAAHRATVGPSRPSRSPSPSARTRHYPNAPRSSLQIGQSLNDPGIGSPPHHRSDITNGSYSLDEPRIDEELMAPGADAHNYMTSANTTSATDTANALYQPPPYPDYPVAPQGAVGFANDIPPAPSMGYNPASYPPYIAAAFPTYPDPGMAAAAVYNQQPVLPNMSPTQHYEQALPSFPHVVEPFESRPPVQPNIKPGDQFGPPLQPYMPTPYILKQEPSNPPNFVEPSKAKSPKQNLPSHPKPQAVSPPVALPRSASSSTTRREPDGISHSPPPKSPKPPSSSTSPVAARIATPLRTARADSMPRDPAARQMMAILNDNAAAEAASARRVGEPSVWQQVQYTTKKSRNRRRSTSRSSSAARAATAEAFGDDHPGGGPVGRAASAVEAAGGGSGAWATSAGDAVDRRALANARLMALPHAAASRANSRNKGLLSKEEDEDVRHGG